MSFRAVEYTVLAMVSRCLGITGWDVQDGVELKVLQRHKHKHERDLRDEQNLKGGEWLILSLSATEMIWRTDCTDLLMRRSIDMLLLTALRLELSQLSLPIPQLLRRGIEARWWN